MKVANSSLACKYIDDIIQIAKRNIDRAVEWDLNFIPYCLNEKRIDFIKKEIEQSSLSMRYHLPYSYIEIAHEDKGIREFSISVLKRNLDFINILDGDTAIVHMGNNGICYEEKGLESLDIISRYASKLGIKICVENLISGLTTKVGFLQKCLEIENIYFCLDVGHANYIAKRDEAFLLNIEKLLPFVQHSHIYHIEDEKFNHLAFTKDTIRNDTLIKRLITFNSKVWMTMELENIVDQNNQIKILEEYKNTYKYKYIS